MENKKTKISFKLVGNNEVMVMRGGKRIGRIWSQSDDGTTPYPHDSSEYCLNSVQICGFDRISETWACGPFQGKKDCVIHFMDLESDYYYSKEQRYKSYVENFLNKGTPIQTMQSFTDWLRHQI